MMARRLFSTAAALVALRAGLGCRAATAPGPRGAARTFDILLTGNLSQWRAVKSSVHRINTLDISLGAYTHSLSDSVENVQGCMKLTVNGPYG
jgi:hypothetical protein